MSRDALIELHQDLLDTCSYFEREKRAKLIEAIKRIKNERTNMGLQ